MAIKLDRINTLIDRSGKTYIELEKRTGITKSSLQRYATGATTKIPLDVIEKLAAEFNVSPAYLLGWENDEGYPILNEEERIWLKLFRSIPENKKATAIELLQTAIKLI